MSPDFDVLRSDKNGLDGPESYVVSREGIGYLRLLGSEPQWSLITATASEDHGRIEVCNDTSRLIESALRLGVEIGTYPNFDEDWKEREFIRICVVNQLPGEERESVNQKLVRLLTRFFEIYDEHRPLKSRSGNEMRELYASLATDDSGNDLCLGDGLWLSVDGSLHDRGR
jgi:hypothetical protein